MTSSVHLYGQRRGLDDGPGGSWSLPQAYTPQGANRFMATSITSDPVDERAFAWTMNRGPPVGPALGPVDPACYLACATYGAGNTPAACTYLCGVQAPPVPAPLPPMDPAGSSGSWTATSPMQSQVAMNSCIRQCDATMDVYQQQACRLGCVAITHADPYLSSASGGCVAGCLKVCQPGDDTCPRRCLASCLGQVEEFPVASGPFMT